MKEKNNSRVRLILLMAGDVVSVYGVLCFSLLGYRMFGGMYSPAICLKLWFFPLIVLILNMAARLYGGNVLYPGISVNKVDELKLLTRNLVGAYVLLFAYLGLTRTNMEYSRFAITLALGLSFFAVPAVRFFLRRLLNRFDSLRIPVLIAGAGKTGRMVGKELKEDSYNGFRPVGYLDDDDRCPSVIAPLSEGVKTAEKMGVQYLIVCLPPAVFQRYMDEWTDAFQHILVIPDNRVFPVLGTSAVNIGVLSGLEISSRMKMPFCRFCKWLTEFCMALLVLPFLLPVFLVVAVLVKLTSRGPVFYRASRLGRNGKPIRILKFRSMYQDADVKLKQLLESDPVLKKEWEEKFKLEKDPRITPFGRFLRKTSIDELPQFWNVVRGEMALIGPRPIVKDEIRYYGDQFKVFSRVKPGITGLWQVSGRSETTYEERVNLDIYYVSNWSFWLDYYIFLKTIPEVLLRKGAK